MEARFPSHPHPSYLPATHPSLPTIPPQGRTLPPNPSSPKAPKRASHKALPFSSNFSLQSLLDLSFLIGYPPADPQTIQTTALYRPQATYNQRTTRERTRERPRDVSRDVESAAHAAASLVITKGKTGVSLVARNCLTHQLSNLTLFRN